MWARVNTQKPLFVVLVPLIALAWVSLLLWGLSPYARFLNHDALEGVHLEHNPGVLAILVAGWTLMLVAMMLPTTLPLIGMFYSIAAQRPNRVRLVGLLVAGYIVIWALMLLMFGVGAGSFAWMPVLGGVMAIEKNMPWGRRLTTSLGVFLLGLGFIEFASSLW